MVEKKAVIYPCFGGFSNTGITTALASLEAIREVGLDKACIGCLAGLPTNAKMVYSNTDKASKIITVDGCPLECARKIVEDAGYKPTNSILLARDIGMKKHSLYEGSEGPTDFAQHIDDEEVKKAKDLIVKAILEDYK
jgi:uncharacterized metal-binding protein